ncbi:MAG: aquaporin [Actinomycetota bacterium]|nr:aquaporin [Actinomycetota bacterium]
MKTLREQLTAEFFGTFSLVFIGAGSAALLGFRPDIAGLIGIALAHGLVLAVMVSALAHISGGHFNPAVTVSVWVSGKIETLRGLAYIAAQLVGAAAGAALLRVAVPERLWRHDPTSLGATALSRQFGVTPGNALLLEATLTFFLVFTVFAVLVDDRGAFKSVAGIPIGLVLTFDILVGGFLTGASMNPARSFGPALLIWEWRDFWIYLAGPLAGGIVAASIYWFSFLRGRVVTAPRTETPIGGGPEEELPMTSGPEEPATDEVLSEEPASGEPTWGSSGESTSEPTWRPPGQLGPDRPRDEP